MRNKLLSLIIIFIVGSTQLSFAAFPVKQSAVVQPTTTVVAEQQTPSFFEKASGRLNNISSQLQQVRHHHFSLFPERRKGTVGLLSLIFGIVGFAAFPFSIAAIVLGAIGRKHNERYSKAGLILGIVGLAIDLFYAILFIIIISSFV